MFHIEWDKDAIEWYVDGKPYHVLTKAKLEAMGLKWVFDQPFFLIVNVAVGGHWPGYPDETTQFPQRMYIDYIRVYEDVGPEIYEEVEEIELKRETHEATFEKINKPSFDEPIVNDQASKPDEWFIWEAGSYGISGARVSDHGVKDGYAYITIANVGTDTWHIQFNQWIGLKRGKSYTISFKAKADVPRLINVKILQKQAPWINYFVQTVNLTTEWQTFTYSYTHPKDADEVVQISFELGLHKPTTIYFDEVTVEPTNR